jgi:hypothetical protein
MDELPFLEKPNASINLNKQSGGLTLLIHDSSRLTHFLKESLPPSRFLLVSVYLAASVSLLLFLVQRSPRSSYPFLQIGA